MLVLTIVVEYADNLMCGSTIPYFQTLTVSERNIGPSMLSLSIPSHLIHTYNSLLP